VYDLQARTFSSAESFLRVTRRIVRIAASMLSYFSAILPPSCYAKVEKCVSANRP